MRPRTLECQGQSCKRYQRGYPWPERLPRHDGTKGGRCPSATRKGRHGNHRRLAETEIPWQRRATAVFDGNVYRTQPENGSIAGQGLQTQHAERLQHFGGTSTAYLLKCHGETDIDIRCIDHAFITGYE